MYYAAAARRKLAMPGLERPMTVPVDLLYSSGVPPASRMATWRHGERNASSVREYAKMCPCTQANTG